MTIHFKKKIVPKLNEETKPILASLAEAFPDSKHLRNILKIDDEKNSKGNIVGLYIIKAIEMVTDKDLGSKVVELPEELHLTHAKHAEDIFSIYQDYLNGLLKEAGKEDCYLKETDLLQLCSEETIENRFVLTREILRRLVALALSNEVSSGQDGQTLIEGLKQFIAIIIEKGTLNIKKIGCDPSLSTFADHLVDERHGAWIENFEEIVNSERRLNAFSGAMKKTRDYLRIRETQIRVFLTITLNLETPPRLLTTDTISTALDIAEKRIGELAQKKKHKTKQSPKILIKKTPDESQTQSAQTMENLTILEWKVDERTQVNKLYQLLEDTMLLIDTVASIEDAHKGLGWLPVISGIFDFSGLTQVITDYNSLCIQLLNRERFKRTQFDTTLARIMVSNKSISFIDCIGGFSALENDKLREIIKNHINKTFSGLKKFHDQLSSGKLFNKSYSIINLNNIEKLEMGVDSIVEGSGDDCVSDFKRNLQDEKISKQTKKTTDSKFEVNEESSLKPEPDKTDVQENPPQYDFIVMTVNSEEKNIQYKAAKLSDKNNNCPVLIKSGITYYVYGNTVGNIWNLIEVDSRCLLSLTFPEIGKHGIIKYNNLINPTLEPVYEEIRLKKAHSHITETSKEVLDQMTETQGVEVIEWDNKHWEIGGWFGAIGAVIGGPLNVVSPFICPHSNILIRGLAGAAAGGGVGLGAGLAVGYGVKKSASGYIERLKLKEKELQDEQKKRHSKLEEKVHRLEAEKIQLEEKVKELENDHSGQEKISTASDRNGHKVQKASNNPYILSPEPRKKMPPKSENQDNFAQRLRT